MIGKGSDGLQPVARHQHRHARLAAARMQHGENFLLPLKIHAAQRLVENEQGRSVEQRLRKKKPLSFPAGELTQRLLGQRLGAGKRQCCVQTLCKPAPPARQTETRAMPRGGNQARPVSCGAGSRRSWGI